MLEDYIDDVKKKLSQSLDSEVEKLIAADAARHDYIKGRVHALREALVAIKEVEALYVEPAFEEAA